MLAGAQFQKVLKPELRQTLYADSLLQVTYKGQDALVHFEFQSSNDANMAERLLLYNIQASHAYDYLQVYSYVIYLRRGGHIEQSPLIRYFPDGGERIRFHFRSIELWNISEEDLFSIDFNGLLPLVLLTRDGKEQASVEQVIEKLISANERGLLAISYSLGGLVFKAEQEHDWFKGRFHMLRDILEESWTYQELKEDAKEAARREVAQEAHQLELTRLRSALSAITQKRFPKLARMAKPLGNGIDEPDVLLNLIINISTAHSLEEATNIFIALGSENDEE